MRALTSLLALIATLTTTLGVPQSYGQAQNSPAPCSAAEYRAFDFWLGQWQVSSPERPGWQASSTISLSNNGCSVHEAYATPGGYAGRSVNFFDSTRGMWHQTWVDNQGSPLYLEGKFVDDSMVLSDGNNRISWTVQADGRVRQHWQTTQDNGKTWSTAFDGYYQKVKSD